MNNRKNTTEKKQVTPCEMLSSSALINWDPTFLGVVHQILWLVEMKLKSSSQMIANASAAVDKSDDDERKIITNLWDSHKTSHLRKGSFYRDHVGASFMYIFPTFVSSHILNRTLKGSEVKTSMRGADVTVTSLKNEHASKTVFLLRLALLQFMMRPSFLFRRQTNFLI